MAFLEVSDLSISFKTDAGWVESVKHVSLSVEAGKKLAIVGESGSGKSVTSLAIMGLLPKRISKISSGHVKLNGKELFDEEVDLRKDLRGKEMAMIFQEPMTSLNPLITCGEQVMEVLMFHEKISRKEALSKTIQLFEEVKLPRPEDMINNYPHELSGGQKQRVMIAIAMACSPKLLIADEPTTALDVTVQGEILDLIDELVHEKQMACIFITHDLGLVRQFADEVVVMYRGELIEQGKVEDVFTNPKEAYTKGLIACKPTLKTSAYRLPTVADFLDTENVFVELPKKKAVFGDVLLDVQNTSVEYVTQRSWLGKPTKKVVAVSNASFQVLKGETIGLVGESGCGKTTLGRAILGLEKTSSGHIFFKGIDVTRLTTSELKKYWNNVQIIFQDPYSSLNPRVTIGEAIVEVMRVHNIGESESTRRDEAIKLLETVGLSGGHFQRFPHEFSGGQRQRICIARTLAMKPELIVCDESVSALDVSVQAQVLNLLNDLKEQFGLTYIFISHDLSVVKYMSDRIVVMKKGEIVEQGDAEQIYESPQEEYTKKLLSSIPS